jgi:hypothetical protein
MSDLHRPSKRSSRKPRPVRAILGGAFVLSTVLGVLTLRNSLAAASGYALSLAERADELSEGLPLPLKRIELNGQPLLVTTGLKEGDVKGALDDFAVLCRRPKESARRGMPLLRQTRDDRGIQGCFLPAQGRSTWQELMRTRDVETVGHVAMLYARKTKENRVHVLLIETQPPFHLLDMFPAQGDAPGSDSPHVPRPSQARRILSGVAVGGAPYAVRLYETSSSTAASLDEMEGGMLARGYTKLGDQLEGKVNPSEQTRMFIGPSGAQVIIVASRWRERTSLAVMDLGRGLETSDTKATEEVKGDIANDKAQ